MVEPAGKKPITICLLTGDQGSGKTTFLLGLHRLLKVKNIPVGGIVAVGTWNNGKRHDFTLHDLSKKDKMLFCKRDEENGWTKSRHFYINPQALIFGRKILAAENLEPSGVVIIDEIGPFELEGEGWSAALSRLIENRNHALVLSVRRSLVENVINHWDLQNCCRYDVSDNRPEELAAFLEMGFYDL